MPSVSFFSRPNLDGFIILATLTHQTTASFIFEPKKRKKVTIVSPVSRKLCHNKKKRNEVLCWYFIFLQITDQKSRGVSYQKREKNDKWHQSDRWFHYFLKPSNFAWITARNFNSLLKITTKQFSNGQILPLKFQVTNSLILFLRKKKRDPFLKGRL